MKINLRENIFHKNIEMIQIGGKKTSIVVDIVSTMDSIDNYEVNNIVLKFTNTNHVIISTLRRIILTLIPIYSYAPNNIIFEMNDTIYNNDYMRLRLSNFPIYLTNDFNKYSTLKEARILEYRANLGSKEIDETSLLDLKFSRDDLQMVINVKNNSNTENMYVETNSVGVSFFLNNKQIEHPYKRPLLIIILRPNESFKVICKSDLNIALKNAIYRCCTQCYFTEESSTEYLLYLSSRRQISEKEIIIRACDIIIEKIVISIKIINNKINDNELSLLEGILELEGEFHTLGNLLVRFLQDHKDIEYAGYSIGHPSISMIKIKYIGKEKINKILTEIQTEIVSVFTDIRDQIKNKI